MIYFTSDLYLGHKAVINSACRPFLDTEEEAYVLIDRINKECKANDDLYILGNFAHRLPKEKAEEYLSKIRARVHMISGNYDMEYNQALMVETSDYIRLKKDHEIFCLFHYPIDDWDAKRYGSYMLHGHINSKGPEYNLRMKKSGLRRYDVGVDANDYKPVSIEKIRNFFGCN